MNSFIFLGGDLRMIYAAKRLNKEYKSTAYGFDGIEIPCEFPLLKTALKADCVVLPLPLTVDGENINAPYSREPVPIEKIPLFAKDNAVIFTGKECPALVKLCADHGYTLIDYFCREELQVMNAVPTAEGAIEIALREMAATLAGSRVLITGYGRIGRALAPRLKAFGAEITVCARKYEQLAWAEADGCKTVSLNTNGRLEELLPCFDIVFNTVPARIFGRERLLLLKKDCLIIDLASKTGIDDLELAKNAGVRVIWALSLPGKTAPVTAGEIIASTIHNIISEKGGTLNG